MKKNEIIAKYNKFVANTYHNLPIVLKEGKGIWLKDVDGKEYMDFWSTYSAMNLGHNNTRLNKVVDRVLKKGCLTARPCYCEELAILGEKLSQLTKMDIMIIPKNGGSESVETAIKAMRMYAYRERGIPKDKAEIIVAEGNFHGRTTTIISFSSVGKYKDDFGPLTPGFKIVPYNNSEAIEKAITPNTIGVLLEPIQGEGGVNVPSKDYLFQVRRICTKHNLLLALDEIQTGMGRTGKMFCYEHSAIKPDLLILGKALGGGIVPISVLVGRREIMKHWVPGDDGSTLGGYALAAAVACEVIDIFTEEKIPEKVFYLGMEFITALKTISSPYIKEVRGKGLMIGIQLSEKVTARAIVEELLKEGLLCGEARGNVLRLTPPLIIKERELDWAFDRLKKVLKSYNEIYWFPA